MKLVSKIQSEITLPNRQNSGQFLSLILSQGGFHLAATALLGIFLPIFLFQMSGGTFLLVGSYYAALSLLYVLFLAPSVQLVNRLGFSYTLLFGGLFGVIMTTFLFLVNPTNFHVFLLPIMFSMLFFWIFHWIPHHVDLLLLKPNKEPEKKISRNIAVAILIGVIGPIFAGLVIEFVGYKMFFGLVFCLLILATISYVYMPDTKIPFSWSMRRTWWELFNREHRKELTREFLGGAEVIVSLVVWPIFLFEILLGNMVQIGAVATAVVTITILAQLYLSLYIKTKGRLVDISNKISSGLYVFGWIIKIFVVTVWQVLAVGLAHNIVRIFSRMPTNVLVYDASADQGKYKDEFTVLNEMANHLGRASSLIVISFLSIFVSISWTFVVAALISIALHITYHRHGR
jgi:hypothetical protein